MGLVPRDTLWTIKKAVYGLRCSPKAWGEERDQKFRQLRWSIKGVSYRLTQCINDSQVWKVIEDCGDEREQLDRARIVGLVICYVDDLLMLFERGEVRQEFTTTLRRMWKLSTEQELGDGEKFMFLGLELERNKVTGSYASTSPRSSSRSCCLMVWTGRLRA